MDVPAVAVDRSPVSEEGVPRLDRGPCEQRVPHWRWDYHGLGSGYLGKRQFILGRNEVSHSVVSVIFDKTSYITP